MSADIIKYSQQLRRLVHEYYRQQITLDDYLAQRKLIFDHIESELAGGNNEVCKTAALDESISHT